jgi:GntR family transcriptional regulator
MFQIDVKSRKPIYTQIVDNFKRMIIGGALAPDTKVPSVRDMAGQLTVNPNTVQKAYRELENQGYFYTVIGQGNFIAKPDAGHELEALFECLRKDIQELLYRGVRLTQILSFMHNVSVGAGGGDDKR